MKLSALIAIFMAGVTSMFAMTNSSPENTRCRDLSEAPKNIAADLRIAQDLVNGVWASPEAFKFEFNTDGTLTIFSKNKNGDVNASVSEWEILLSDGTTILYISENGTKNISYKVEQTCTGIDLTNIRNHDLLSLEYISAAMPGRVNHVRKNLTGEWTNVTYFESGKKCANAKGAYLDYRFEKNGGYICEYGSSTENKIEKGTWSVSKDGQYLLLTNEAGNISVVRIAQVDNHGLMLEQAMRTNEIGDFFCTEQTAFHFIK